MKVLNNEFYVIIFYNIVMLFHEKLGRGIITLIGLVFFIILLRKNKSEFDIVQRLLLMACIYIPTSFISIIGTSYGTLPITWFNISLISIYLILLKRKFIINYYFFSPLIMVIFWLFTIFNESGIFSSAKQLITIVLFIISFFIGEGISNISDNKFIKKLKVYYLCGVYSFSISIYIQRILSEKFLIYLGHYEVLGNNRIVSAGLMSDYSFASLYIATAGVIILINYFNSKEDTIKLIYKEIFLISSIILVNSRTGLFSMFIVSGIYLIYKILKINLKALIILLVLLIILPSIFSIVIKNRGGQEIFESSGRGTLNQIALREFSKKPLLGIGFGVERWTYNTGVVLPHNLIFQYLAQIGIIGSMIVYSNLFLMLYKYLKYKSEFWWVLITVLIGAMAIPDIVSSRFLNIIIILTIISSINNKKEHRNKEKYEKVRKIIKL